jgi:hypothetical protein
VHQTVKPSRIVAADHQHFVLAFVERAGGSFQEQVNTL